MTAPTTPIPRPTPTPEAGGLSAAVSDLRVMTSRELRRVVRSIDAMITFVVVPVMILTMFVFVFGGAISTGGRGAYIDYVVPGVLLLCAGFGSASTAVSVSQDLTTGTIDRFRTMPIFGSAVLVGHASASLIRNLLVSLLVVAVAFAYGFRPDASLGGWLAAAGLLALFILAFTWVACLIGLLVGPEAANGATFVMLFLPYVSSGFVPAESMPGPLQAFAAHQPLTSIIETLRSLLLGTPVGSAGVQAVAWCVGILVVSYAAATYVYARR